MRIVYKGNYIRMTCGEIGLVYIESFWEHAYAVKYEYEYDSRHKMLNPHNSVPFIINGTLLCGFNIFYKT